MSTIQQELENLQKMNETARGKIFTDLENELAGKIGQLFMIAEYSHGYSMPKLHRSPDILTLGFLSGDKLILDQGAGTWAIPSNEGPAFFKEDDGGLIYLLTKMSGPLDRESPQIITGDKAVLTFFKKELYRSVADEEIVRRDIVLRTLTMQVPNGHWIRAERDLLREESFSDALRLETKIADTRYEIERETKQRGSASLVFKQVEDISQMIQSIGKKIDIAVRLGIDPQRSEILRMRESFGRYWEKK